MQIVKLARAYAHITRCCPTTRCKTTDCLCNGRRLLVRADESAARVPLQSTAHVLLSAPAPDTTRHHPTPSSGRWLSTTQDESNVVASRSFDDWGERSGRSCRGWGWPCLVLHLDQTQYDRTPVQQHTDRSHQPGVLDESDGSAHDSNGLVYLQLLYVSTHLLRESTTTCFLLTLATLPCFLLTLATLPLAFYRRRGGTIRRGW